ncbi:MAG TPA: type II toxin-antitoxin system RelE/ParE family toxin, partial [Rhodanobacteraceae bacterium]
AAAKELNAIGATQAARIVRFLSTRLSRLDDPRSIGEALKGRLGQLWKYRIGDYRIIADIQDKRVLILIVRIGHRREVYKR